MIPPFSMLAIDAFPQPLAGSVGWLSGPAIGRVPELGDPLRICSPFAIPLRTKLRALGGTPRGTTTSAVTLGIGTIPSLHVEQLRGALICEEGVHVRTFTARTSHPECLAAPARFKLGDDHAWGLIRMLNGIVNLAVVGGGLGTRDFWHDLELVRIEGRPHALSRGDLDPITTAETDRLWQLPELTSYTPSSQRRAVAVRPMGPVKERYIDLWLGDRWEQADVFQNDRGLTQVLFSDEAFTGLLAARVPTPA
jgi:hypothetical protein